MADEKHKVTWRFANCDDVCSMTFWNMLPQALILADALKAAPGIVDVRLLRETEAEVPF